MKKVAEEHGTGDLLVVFGLNQPSTLEIMARTFRDGDPSYAGALGGVALGLKSYHILELKQYIPPEVWEEQMAMHELEIEDAFWAEIRRILEQSRGE